MKKQRFWNAVRWITILFLLLAGGIFRFLMTGYSFLAYCLWATDILLLVYRILELLIQRHPRPWRALRQALTICLCLFLAASAVTGCIIYAGSRGSADQSCSYIIVLGAGVNGTVPSLSLRERLEAARTYLLAHPETVCIVSGGQGGGELISEAQCMYDWLIAGGIPAAQLRKEEKASNTVQNLKFSVALIQEENGVLPVPIGVVSSEYHLYRAGLIAKSIDIESVGIPARTGMPILRVNYFLREILAVWYFLVFQS